MCSIARVLLQTLALYTKQRNQENRICLDTRSQMQTTSQLITRPGHRYGTYILKYKLARSHISLYLCANIYTHMQLREYTVQHYLTCPKNRMHLVISLMVAPKRSGSACRFKTAWTLICNIDGNGNCQWHKAASKLITACVLATDSPIKFQYKIGCFLPYISTVW